MSAINPIGGLPKPIPTPQATGVGGQDQDASKTGFDKMLRNCIDQVDTKQQASTAAVQDLLSGKSDDVLSVVAAAAKADLSFKLLIGVRNKVIEAYKQTMNMQI